MAGSAPRARTILTMVVIALVAGAAAFAVGFVAGRYASWFGSAVPVALTLLLGYAWGWDPDGVPLAIAAGVLAAFGVMVGLARRRAQRARA